MGGLRMGKPLNAAAGLNAADFANSIRTVFETSPCRSIQTGILALLDAAERLDIRTYRGY
jgi:hypothetical protein